MEKEELIEKLKTVEERIDGDQEDWHWEADNLLLQYINDERVTEAFREIDKWYS